MSLGVDGLRGRGHKKTYLLLCMNSKGADQLVHLHSLTRNFVVS